MYDGTTTEITSGTSFSNTNQALSTLTFASTLFTDKGTYYCTVTYGSDSFDSQTAELYVRGTSYLNNSPTNPIGWLFQGNSARKLKSKNTKFHDVMQE